MTELVIFDCDGVLVDSEGIGNAVLAQAATQEGAAISAEEALHLFRGLKMAECVVEIERRSGRRVRDDFVADVRRDMATAFESNLRAVKVSTPHWPRSRARSVSRRMGQWPR